MLTSKSTQGCRLSANAPHVIRAVGRTGLTSGTIDPADALGKSKPKATPKKSKNRRGKQRPHKSIRNRNRGN